MATASSHSHDHGHDHAHADGAVHAHVAPWQFYWGIFGALIVLTFITVGVSYVDLGAANTVIAVLVATMKATLVAAFFMHLAHDKLFNTICLVAAFAFLILFFAFTYEDVGARARIDETNGAPLLLKTGEEAPGGISQDIVKLVEKADRTAGGHGGHGAPAHGAPAHGAAPAHDAPAHDAPAGEHAPGKPAEHH